MPAIYAHKRFGELVFQALSEPLQKAFEPYKACYLLGFEGPDILFYHKPFKTNDVRAKAIKTHLLSAKPFFVENAKKILNQTAPEPLSTPIAAYVAGFICHFCLDNACHPRVYELEFTGVSHGLIESEFDKFVIQKDGKKVHGRNPARHLSNTSCVAKVSATVLDVEPKEIRRALTTIKFINGVFACRYKRVHKLVHWFLRHAGKEDSYGGMLLHHEDDPKCSAIMDGLYEDLLNAVPPTVALIEDYFSNLETTASTGVVNETFDKNYTGGILDEHHQPIRR